MPALAIPRGLFKQHLGPVHETRIVSETASVRAETRPSLSSPWAHGAQLPVCAEIRVLDRTVGISLLYLKMLKNSALIAS